MKFQRIIQPFKNCRSLRFSLKLLFSFFIIWMLTFSVLAQELSKKDETETADEQGSLVADRVQVNPVSADAAIGERLTSILEATGWFSDLEIRVEEGVVFLNGRADSADHRVWARELASRTSDVVAVVNRIQIPEISPWDVSPAIDELQSLWKVTLEKIPRLGVGLVVLLLALVAGKLAANGARRVLEQRLNPLLRDVATRVLGIFVFLIGFYLVLQVVGLSGLATTVLGGTGLIGLVAGIAFRDILENYLASVLISVRNPFRVGDLVEIANHTGIVQWVTTRGTVLMNLDGNHVQIPNATVYKSIIRNYTANPNRREFFTVGIGFENKVSLAQEIALTVLENHSAVLKDPEALVLVDELGSATVNLKIYFWYDGRIYNRLKVRSSLIRQVKQAFETNNISMPDEAREVIFPDGVRVQMLDTGSAAQAEVKKKGDRPAHGRDSISEAVATEAEGDLASEEVQLREQAKKARIPEAGASLLEESDP